MIRTSGENRRGAKACEQMLEDEVRQPGEDFPSITPYEESSPPLAHHSNWLVARLNESWRVVDDPLQWILQQKKGNSRSKNSGWRNRSYCRTQEALLRCICEYCCLLDHGQTRSIGEYRGVDEVALQKLRALPEWHVDR